MASTEIITNNSEDCSGKMRNVHDGGWVQSVHPPSSPLPQKEGENHPIFVRERKKKGLQQVSQTVDVGLDCTSSNITPRPWATDNQRIITIPTAFDGENIIARE